MTNYPEKFIRGVSNPSFVDKIGRASADIFQFTDMNRKDGFFEVSINWYDDEDARNLIWEQRKLKDESRYQFKGGIAIINRSVVDELILDDLFKDVVQYERSPIEGNKYHGNILRKDGELDRGIRITIASYLAIKAKVFSRKQET
jgi:hypothetical protein